MTRLEQLQKKQEAAKQKRLALEEKQKQERVAAREKERVAAAATRVQGRIEDNKRRFRHGSELDEAGLFALTPDELKAVIVVLGRARQIPHLADVLLQALGDWLLPEEQEPGKTLEEQVEALVSEL